MPRTDTEDPPTALDVLVRRGKPYRPELVFSSSGVSAIVAALASLFMLPARAAIPGVTLLAVTVAFTLAPWVIVRRLDHIIGFYEPRWDDIHDIQNWQVLEALKGRIVRGGLAAASVGVAGILSIGLIALALWREPANVWLGSLALAIAAALSLGTYVLLARRILRSARRIKQLGHFVEKAGAD